MKTYYTCVTDDYTGNTCGIRHRTRETADACIERENAAIQRRLGQQNSYSPRRVQKTKGGE
jgi:hypothetical protein